MNTSESIQPTEPKKLRLENWAVVDDPYKAPEQRRPRLQGLVYNHRSRLDGSQITTSYIIKLEGGSVRTYSGSLYELGTVDPEWEKLFPNAAERFKTSFDADGNIKKA